MAFAIPPALKRSPIRSAPLKPLLAPLLVFLLVVLFIVSRDAFLEVPLLLSRCSSHAIHPSIGRALPILGPYACFAVSYYEATLASTRGLAFMSVVFAFTAALLTVTYIESSRTVAGPGGGYLRRLGLLWFLAHIAAGPYAFVFIAAGWIVTTYREINRIRSAGQAPDAAAPENETGTSSPAPEEGDTTSALDTQKRQALRRRRLRSSASALAIADAVLIGFALPSALALIYRSPGAISFWLLWPLWVPLLRYGLITLVEALDARRQANSSSSSRGSGIRSLDVERTRPALALIYVVPVILSIAAHVALIWSLTRKDKSKAVTRAALSLELVNWGAILVITLYALFVEAGWRALLGAVLATVILGPGAGVCVGWFLREQVIRRENDEDIDAAAETHQEDVGEETPLLRS